MNYLPSSYYKPLLPNGRPPPIDWQIYGFFCSNCWPLAANVSKGRVFLDLFLIIMQYAFDCLMLYGETKIIYENLDNISFVCIVLAPTLILVEFMLRVSNILYMRNSFRVHLEEFYKKIYIERYLYKHSIQRNRFVKAFLYLTQFLLSSWNPELFEQIRLQQLPTKYSTFTYIITLWTYIYIPINGLLHDEHLLPFKVSFNFDYTTSLPRYIFFLCISTFTSVAVVGPLVAESNLLAMQILHLNARYSLLLRDLHKIARDAIDAKEENNISVTSRFRYGLVEVIRRNVELNNFANSLQTQYSFRIFIMMALSTTLLCVLGFLTATLGLTLENIRFVSWIIGKVVELLIFGRLGTTLSTTTNDMSTSYYSCGWEDVILHSDDAVENAKLMKLMALAIHLNSDPFQLSGLNFFYVNYEVVVSILRGAGSYFTVIYAYR